MSLESETKVLDFYFSLSLLIIFFDIYGVKYMYSRLSLARDPKETFVFNPKLFRDMLMFLNWVNSFLSYFHVTFFETRKISPDLDKIIKLCYWGYFTMRKAILCDTLKMSAFRNSSCNLCVFCTGIQFNFFWCSCIQEKIGIYGFSRTAWLKDALLFEIGKFKKKWSLC